MRIIIYNPNSRGGNFDYALELCKAYQCHPEVSEVVLVLPVNAIIADGISCQKILIADVPPSNLRLVSRLHFLLRTFVNPFRLFFFLSGREGYVVFNDYDQTSSFIWAPLFRMFRKKNVFCTVLHDPDRDHYFPFRWLSVFTMKKVMKLMDIAFFHDTLPDRPYYKNCRARFVAVPHGLYDIRNTAAPDQDLRNELNRFKENDVLIGAVGNIRHEKNYALLIAALREVRGMKLLISGIAANTSVDVNALRSLIAEHGLTNRVFVFEKYASRDELKSIGEVCDAFVLYYAATFQSQSGVLNLFATFQKPLLVSDNGSPLATVVKRFNLGLWAKPDSKEELQQMLIAFGRNKKVDSNWEGYFRYASWENHVHIALAAMKGVRLIK